MHKTRFIVQRAISLTGALLMCTQVYTKLNERLGLKDHATVLNAMVAKMAINLKVYGDCDDIIHATLNLFQVADWLVLVTMQVFHLRHSRCISSSLSRLCSVSRLTSFNACMYGAALPSSASVTA